MVLEKGRKRRKGFRGRIVSVLLAASLFAGPAATAFYKQEGTLKSTGDRTREEQNLDYFTDLPVITHEGKERRFYSDILKGRVVMISFFYTNCPTAKPDNEKIAEIRGLLEGEEGIGKEVLFVSISADPERDTPVALKEYAERYGGGGEWVFLTGTKESMRTINLKLGNRNPDPESHIRVYLLGNLDTGHWIRMNEFAPSPTVVEGLRSLTGE